MTSMTIETTPADWCAEHRSSLRSSLESLLTAEGEPSNPIDSANLLRSVYEHLSFTDRRSADWITFGPIAVPSSPAGVAELRRLREHATIVCEGGLSFIEDGSKLALLRDACEDNGASAILGSLRTSPIKRGIHGIRLKFDIGAEFRSYLPNGDRLPSSLLTTSLVGQELDSEDVRNFAENSGACEDGVRQFLERFRIPYDASGGECGECGSEHEGEGIDWCETFKLTTDMVNALEEANYADDVRDILESAGSADGWAELLGNTDEEILSLLKPEEKGIAYDRDRWTFVPDFAELDGLSDLDFCDLARILPLLATVAAAYAEKGLLPPIPGTLDRKAERWGMIYGAAKNGRLSWDPSDGTLDHQVRTGGVRLRIDAVLGNMTLIVPSGETVCVNDGEIVAPTDGAGDTADTWFLIAQGESSI